MADKNEIVNQVKQGITSFLSSDAVKQNIVQVVGEKESQQFIASVISAVQANPSLAECTNKSVLSCALLGQALKLSPSPQLGNFCLVPYNNKKKINNQWVEVKEAQFQLGYKGFVQLAIRSGQYRKLVVADVKQGELKKYNAITEEFELDPIDEEMRNNLPTVGYYAMLELMNGFKKEIYWSRTKMEAHAKQYSSGYRNDLVKKTQYTFWSKNFDDMGKKTMLRQLISKWGIMSIEMQKAFESDQAIIGENGEVNYIDNETSDVPTESAYDAFAPEPIDVESVEVEGEPE